MSEANVDLERFIRAGRERVERHLDVGLPPPTEPPVSLHEAMRYAVLSGGKRLRPLLAFAAAEAVGADPSRVLPVAAAAELVHAYSLVHDDLPAMDDDRERRGLPTVHVKFGEATAILCGDALLAEAFVQLLREQVPNEVVERLAQTASSRALVGGQADDLGGAAELAAILSIHERKTAALFGFSVWGAGRLVGAGDAELRALDAFGLHYGRAFQLIDDLRDAPSDECSILRVLPSERVRERALDELAESSRSVAPLGEQARWLSGMSDQLAGRLT